MDVAVDADDAGAREDERAGGAVAVEAEVERGDLGEAEDVVVDAVEVGERHRRADAQHLDVRLERLLPLRHPRRHLALDQRRPGQGALDPDDRVAGRLDRAAGADEADGDADGAGAHRRRVAGRGGRDGRDGASLLAAHRRRHERRQEEGGGDRHESHQRGDPRSPVGVFHDWISAFQHYRTVRRRPICPINREP